MMELKNALSVCLISLVSASLVVLIARSLDSQAASRLEPQLERIADELQTLRRAGGMPASSGGEAEVESVDDGLMVYYFHSNARCPTCRSIESQSHAAVQEEFAAQLDNGELVWKVLNYERPAGAELAKRFEVQMPVVVVARMKDGQIADWKRLDQVWALVGDEPSFREYVRGEIATMLASGQTPPADPAPETPTDLVPAGEPNDVPLPADPGGLPLPQ